MRKFVALVMAWAIAAALAESAVAQSSATLSNGGFEKPDILSGASAGAEPQGWLVFASGQGSKPGITDARKKGGAQCAHFKAQTETNAFQGIAQDFTLDTTRHYTFTVNVMNDPADPLVGAAYGQISIEWKDAEGKEISRTHGPTWNYQLSSSRWEKYSMDADLPENTAKGVAVVTFFSQDCKGMGSFYLDDCELTSRAK